jgi:hypothetical protein
MQTLLCIDPRTADPHYLVNRVPAHTHVTREDVTFEDGVRGGTNSALEAAEAEAEVELVEVAAVAAGTSGSISTAAN